MIPFEMTHQEIFMTQIQNRRIPPYNEETKEHFWIITAVFRYNPAIVTPVLDVETMVMLPAVGCWHCEQEYSQALLNTPCPGDPL